ncbi:hypothetical protein [Nocardia sp. NPDC050793]|uniref:hypothetical protein n=1 Tax=Nocardia sp. NPDC050793 TaxID=3155159 RepID=UPI0033EC5B59
MTSAPKPSVLYITGMMRSGSTLVGNILNEVPGVVHVGELHYLWKNLGMATGSNAQCGCGAPGAECEFWAPILDHSIDLGLSAAVVAEQHRHTRVRHTPARLARPTPTRAVPELVEQRIALYRAIHRRTGGSIIVDSSKVPTEPLVFGLGGDIDFRVLHIVRSPHDTVESYRKPKSYIRRVSPLRTLGYWTSFNIAAEMVMLRSDIPGMRIRYEDFIRNPQRGIERILEFMDLPVESPISGDRSVSFGVNHTITGNPDRFRRGAVEIKSGSAPKTVPEHIRRALSMALVAPVALRYGYLKF